MNFNKNQQYCKTSKFLLSILHPRMTIIITKYSAVNISMTIHESPFSPNFEIKLVHKFEQHTQSSYIEQHVQAFPRVYICLKFEPIFLNHTKRCKHHQRSKGILKKKHNFIYCTNQTMFEHRIMIEQIKQYLSRCIQII